MLEVVGHARASLVSEPGVWDLATLYQRYGETVSRWGRRLLGNEAEIEDLLQDVFLVVQRKLPSFRGEAQITTWLYAITVRVAQDRRQRDRWRRWLGLGACQVPSEGPTPLQALESRRAAQLTYALLDRLPEKDRTLLILFELEGLGGDQIAAILGTTTPNVWVRLHRARARFREAYLRWERRGQP